MDRVFFIIVNAMATIVSLAFTIGYAANGYGLIKLTVLVGLSWMFTGFFQFISLAYYDFKVLDSNGNEIDLKPKFDNLVDEVDAILTNE